MLFLPPLSQAKWTPLPAQFAVMTSLTTRPLMQLGATGLRAATSSTPAVFGSGSRRIASGHAPRVATRPQHWRICPRFTKRKRPKRRKKRRRKSSKRRSSASRARTWNTSCAPTAASALPLSWTRRSTTTSMGAVMPGFRGSCSSASFKSRAAASYRIPSGGNWCRSTPTMPRMTRRRFWPLRPSLPLAIARWFSDGNRFRGFTHIFTGKY